MGARFITEPGMERVTTAQAARELNMDVESIQYMLRKKTLPIGYAVRKDGKKRYSYYIYRGLLDAHKKNICEGRLAYKE